MAIACCVCHQIQLNGEWIAQKPANNGQLSHTYCPPCMAVQLNEIRLERDLVRSNPAHVAHAV